MRGLAEWGNLWDTIQGWLALCKAFIGRGRALGMLGVCNAGFRASETG